MKKHFLLAAALLGLASAAQAENQFYFFTEEDPDLGTVDIMGEVYGVSENGRYAAIFDNEMNLSYLWDAENPTKLTLINRTVGGKMNGFTAYSVTNDGMVVGSELPSGSYQWRPMTWQNGEFRNLELPSDASTMNYPVAVTGDGKIIGGEIGYPAPKEEGGIRSYPAVWELGSDGEYALTVYNDMELPAMQGFFVNCMYTDGTSQGTVLGGTLNAGNGSFVAALCKGGELKIWNELENRIEPFEYCGQILGYFNEGFIDGVKDGWNGDWCNGMFNSCDYAGNFYGIRAWGDQPAPENGEGTYSSTPTIYNVLTDEWTDGKQTISTGIDGNILFAQGGRVLDGGFDATAQPLAAFTETDTQGKSINSVDRIDREGKVLGGCYYTIEPASGEARYYPFIITLDEPLATGVQAIYAEPEAKIGIIVTNGRIITSGAENVAIYDLDGRLISKAADASVEPGIYVVKADSVSRKVLVK